MAGPFSRTVFGVFILPQKALEIFMNYVFNSAREACREELAKRFLPGAALEEATLVLTQKLNAHFGFETR